MKRIFWSLAALLFIPTMALAQFNPSTATTPVLTPAAVANAQYNASTKWNYAAASGGITDTTAVVIKAAAGVGKRSYIRSCQFSNSGAAGTEIILEQTTGPVVLWRGWIGATANNFNVTFAQPLPSGVNDSLKVVLSSSTTVAVRANCQGTTD